jgi:hypothetical protein
MGVGFDENVVCPPFTPFSPPFTFHLSFPDPRFIVSRAGLLYLLTARAF